MKKSDLIKYAIIISCTIIITVLIVGMFRRPTKNANDKWFKELLAEKDKRIADKQEYIDYTKEINLQKDKSIAAHEAKDSMLLLQFVNNQPKYVSNDKKYKDITPAVTNLTKDQFRRELSTWYEARHNLP